MANAGNLILSYVQCDASLLDVGGGGQGGPIKRSCAISILAV